MPKKDMRFLCYPFMREESCMVDFEIRTDSLAARIGLAASLTESYSEVYADLMHLVKMAYHLNGSVRGRLAITEEDLQWLSEIYDSYLAEVRDRTEGFVLPQGCQAAAVLHTCRSEAKKSVRALHKVSLEKDVPEILFDYANLLANVLFVMAVYMNKKQQIEEIPFVSKSYPNRKSTTRGNKHETNNL